MDVDALQSPLSSYSPGNYKTQLGLKAVVARVVSTKGVWVLVGSVILDGVHYIHVWSLAGKSKTGETKFDLIRSP